MFIRGLSKNTKISNGGSTSTKPVLFVSRHSISTKYDHRSHPQKPKTSIVTPNTITTFRFCCKMVLGILSIIRSLFTKPVSSLLRHSISTTYDHRSHSDDPWTSTDTPNTIITFRFCCMWVLGFPPKIVKNLIEGLCWHRLFYLCPGIQFQSHMTTGATRRYQW